MQHISLNVRTGKAQQKNNPEFGKGACCSYELAELGLLRPFSQEENKGLILKGTHLSGM